MGRELPEGERARNGAWLLREMTDRERGIRWVRDELKTRGFMEDEADV